MSKRARHGGGDEDGNDDAPALDGAPSLFNLIIPNIFRSFIFKSTQKTLVMVTSAKGSVSAEAAKSSASSATRSQRSMMLSLMMSMMMTMSAVALTKTRGPSRREPLPLLAPCSTRPSRAIILDLLILPPLNVSDSVEW